MFSRVFLHRWRAVTLTQSVVPCLASCLTSIPRIVSGATASLTGIKWFCFWEETHVALEPNPSVVLTLEAAAAVALPGVTHENCKYLSVVV